jgi:hypothetical protein
LEGSADEDEWVLLFTPKSDVESNTSLCHFVEAIFTSTFEGNGDVFTKLLGAPDVTDVGAGDLGNGAVDGGVEFDADDDHRIASNIWEGYSSTAKLVLLTNESHIVTSIRHTLTTSAILMKTMRPLTSVNSMKRINVAPLLAAPSPAQ